MENRYIDVFEDNAIAVVTLKRAEKRNALNIVLMDQLCEAFVQLQRSQCRVVIISAEGAVFCAGLDLLEAANPALEEKTAEHVARLLTTIYTSPLVTIAAVQGDALGGGGGLAAACDLVLMAQEAKIGFPEVRRGLVAAQVSTIVMRQISMRYVRELFLTGEPVTAVRALQMGLINKVVKGTELLDEAMRLAQSVVKGAPGAIKITKNLIGEFFPRNFSTDLQHALALHHAIRQSAEAKEGIAAFLEKRPPNWQIAL